MRAGHRPTAACTAPDAHPARSAPTATLVGNRPGGVPRVWDQDGSIPRGLMASVSQNPEAVVEQAVAQPVLTPLTASAVILVLTINEGGEPVVSDLLADLSGLARTVAFRALDGGWPWWRAWGRMPGIASSRALDRPSCIRSRCSTVVGTGPWPPRATCCSTSARRRWTSAGSSPHWWWGGCRGRPVVDEIHGFKYFDERDLLGFVDGTENPTGRAAEVAVTIGDEDPAFAGGSYVIVQKYLHDMAAWERWRSRSRST